jgi:HK97 family phage major capsid protein
MGAMTLEQLNGHIKDAVLPILKGELGDTVKGVVQAAVDEALKPVRGDLGKAQADQETLKTQLKEMAGGISPLSTKSKTRQKGEAFGACVRAAYKSRNDPQRAAKILHDEGNGDLGDLMKAMTAGDPTTGGVLIPHAVSAEIIDILRSTVVVRGLGPQQISMPNGNFRLPKKVQGTQSYYVGESQAAATSGVTVGSVVLNFKKLVTVVPASNDLFRYSSPGADAIIRDDIMDSMRVREDQAFLRDTGVTPSGTSTPKGLRQWSIEAVNNLAITTGATSLANVTIDLGRLILKLVEADVPMTRPGWIMAPKTWNYLMTVRTTNGPYAFRDEMARGTLWGWPFRMTTTIPTNLTVAALTNRSELYLVDFADVVIGDSEAMIIDASGEAAYEEAGTVKSAFHRDETVIRAISEHDLVVRRSQSVAHFEDVNWA